MNSLKNSITATLRLYDCFERPLTGFEIYKSLIKSENTDKAFSLIEILQALKDIVNSNPEIEAFGGFYCLKGKTILIAKRIEKEKKSIAKWHKAKKITKILQFVPYIKMIAISGSLALSNTKPASDLDFFIVAKTSKIWLCRLFTILLTQTLGLRRHGQKIKDRACLNSYITQKALEIKTRDLYSASEYLQLIPLWGLEVYQDFKKNNSWIGEYFFYYSFKKTVNQRAIKNGFFAEIFRPVIEIMLDNQMGDWLEQLAARYQKGKIIRNPKTSWQNSQIIFGDDCLIFHPMPKATIVKKAMLSNV